MIVRAVTAQIHKDLVKVAFGNSWLVIPFLKPWLQCLDWQCLARVRVVLSVPLLAFDLTLIRKSASDDRDLPLLRSEMSLQFRDVFAVSSFLSCWLVVVKSVVEILRSFLRVVPPSAWLCC